MKISRLTGGKHFIINTSENGRGPVHVRHWINRSKHLWRTINVWCHPLLRGAGPAPTTITANPKVDAYMWINRPGYSGGSCNGGPLPVGTWWPERALMFAAYSTELAAPARRHRERALQALQPARTRLPRAVAVRGSRSPPRWVPSRRVVVSTPLPRILLTLAVATVALVLPAGPAHAQAPDPRGADPASPNPLAGQRFFVDFDRQPSARSYRTFKRKGRSRAAALMWTVAREPKFQWFGRWNHSSRAIREFLERAQRQQPGTVPLVTVLRHQGKGCRNRYDGGGAAEDARTRRWYSRLCPRHRQPAGGDRLRARLARHHRLPHPQPPHRAHAPAALWRRRALALPNATIYLEAGASDWEPAKRTAWQLRSIGIAKVRGFMLNVTHYDWTADNIKHGLEISRLTGGKHFIISTAFNGRGPVHYKQLDQSQPPPLAPRQRLVPSAAARRRARAHHDHGEPEGRRLHVDRPARLLGRLLQRRPAADRLVVARRGL